MKLVKPLAVSAMTDLIVDASAQTVAIDHDRIRLIGVNETDDALCDLNRIQSPEFG
jgi:hypothetical protein